MHCFIVWGREGKVKTSSIFFFFCNWPVCGLINKVNNIILRLFKLMRDGNSEDGILQY